MIAALLPPYCRRIAAFAQARLKRFRALFAEDSALPTGFIHGDPSLDTNPSLTLTLPVPLTLTLTLARAITLTLTLTLTLTR